MAGRAAPARRRFRGWHVRRRGCRRDRRRRWSGRRSGRRRVRGGRGSVRGRHPPDGAAMAFEGCGGAGGGVPTATLTQPSATAPTKASIRARPKAGRERGASIPYSFDPPSGGSRRPSAAHCSASRERSLGMIRQAGHLRLAATSPGPSALLQSRAGWPVARPVRWSVVPGPPMAASRRSLRRAWGRTSDEVWPTGATRAFARAAVGGSETRRVMRARDRRRSTTRESRSSPTS